VRLHDLLGRVLACALESPLTRRDTIAAASGVSPGEP
jgi:hypothetical protein